MEVNVEDRKIWWIASYPKSGNTWVRMFINAYLSGFPLDINTGFQYAMGDNNLGFFQSVYCRQVDQLTVTEQVFLRPAVLMTILSMSAAKHVCVKSHHAKVQVDGMPLFPAKISAGAVYIIRDPRDIAISFADHLGSEIDPVIENMNEKQYVSEHQTTRLTHILTTWSLHVKTWTEKNKDIPVTVIRYEDMLLDPHVAFLNILKALGFEELNMDKFTFALDQTEFKNLQRIEKVEGFREKGQGDKFFRAGKANQWPGILTQEQITRIEEAHGEVMQEHGYELSEALV